MWCDLSLWAMKAYNLPLLVELSDPAASFQWNIKHKPLHLLWTTFATMIYGSLEVQGRNNTGTAIKSNQQSQDLTHILSPSLKWRVAQSSWVLPLQRCCPMGAAPGQTQPPAGIKLQEGFAAGRARPGTALQVWSLFLLLILTRFSFRSLSLTLTYKSQGKKIKSEAPST